MNRRRHLAFLAALGAASLWRPAARARAPARILHVMSQHSPSRRADGQHFGFADALEGVPLELRVFELDALRRNSTAQKEAAGRQARAVVDAWQPDLLYATDDAAQEFVAAHYVNSPMPVVFSGVRRDPSAFGFRGSRNVTGVFEREHFVESVAMLRALAPRVQRIAAVFDDEPAWAPLVARMRERARALGPVAITAWDQPKTFAEFRARMAAYPREVDAIALIGVSRFKDADGRAVPGEAVLRWTAEHSTLPDFSFWPERVHLGTLAAVAVSEREQGLAAGRLARAILVDRQAPSSLPMEPTRRGTPVVSLRRAWRLGLQPSSSVLLSAQVLTRFDWDSSSG